MNRYKLLTAIVLFFITAGLSAQNYEDILRYSQPQYMGTARSMAMGGAFGSLGGDFSALGINPAGIAVYRTSEFSFTPSLIFNSTESNFEGNMMKDNKTTFSINQVGYVGTYRPMREVTKGVVSTHFGVGYNRNNNFNYRSMAISPPNEFSLTNVFLDDADGKPTDDFEGLTRMAYDYYIIDILEDDEGEYYGSSLRDDDKVNQLNVLEKEGYSGEINITSGINISNILLLGGSINFSSLRYHESFAYMEEFSSQNQEPLYDVFKSYSINNLLDVSGNGINLKFGLIVKPTENLRIGAAYHTPTWYTIEEEYSVKLNAEFFNPKENYVTPPSEYLQEPLSYKISTPSKYIGSISYVLGKIAILSFDYEHLSYANAKFRQSSTEDFINVKNQNDDIKTYLTSTNNYRAGGEFRVNQSISLRAGYAFQPSPYKAAPKDYEYQTISSGIGYRNKNYFIDVAYKNTAFKHKYGWYPNVSENFNPDQKFASITSIDHYATLTLGWKF